MKIELSKSHWTIERRDTIELEDKTMMKPFVKVDEVKEGTVLIPDSGFTCMKADQPKTVLKKEGTGELYILCREGWHFLDGQKDTESNTYVGLYPMTE